MIIEKKTGSGSFTCVRLGEEAEAGQPSYLFVIWNLKIYLIRTLIEIYLLAIMLACESKKEICTKLTLIVEIYQK